MITTAPTPLPTAASTRGNAPNTSLPTGIAVPWMGPSSGALSATPAASPEKSTRPHCTRRPRSLPQSR